MSIEIHNKSSHVQSEEIRSAALFFLSVLLGYDAAKKLDVDVHLCTLRGENGNVMITEYAAPNRPIYFTMELNRNLRRESLLTVLAHECVHIKQYVKRESRPYESTKNRHFMRWKGKKYDTRDLDYWDYPWEIDAYGREKGLVTKYMAYIESLKK